MVHSDNSIIIVFCYKIRLRIDAVQGVDKRTIVDEGVLTYTGVRYCLQRRIVSQVDILPPGDCDGVSVFRIWTARCTYVGPSELPTRTSYVLGRDDSQALY